jgi:hypothetical protein
VIVYKLLFALVGLRHYTPYRVVGVALHLLCATLLYVTVKRRLGPWPALVPTVLLLFMGTAWQDLLWPFQLGWFASIAGGLGALIAIERDRARSDLVAATLLVASSSSSGVGIAFVVASAAALLARRAPWRRSWIVAVPLMLFAIWYLGWGSGEQITSSSVLGAPQYVADAGAGAAAGIAGLSSAWGPPLALVILAAVGLCRWGGRAESPSRLLVAACAGLLTFWVLAAVARADYAEPAASRYLYVGAVFIWLIVAGAITRIPEPRAGWLTLGALAVVGALVANISVLRAGERGLRSTDATVRASLAAVEIAAPVVAPTFVADPVGAPSVSAGPYLVAVRDLGSPALRVAELGRAPASARTGADGVLELAERLTATPVAGGISGDRAPTVEREAGGTSFGAVRASG